MPTGVTDEITIDVDARPLTQRERAVLDGLLAAGCRNVERLRNRAADAVVVGTCGCGCPSVDFQHGRGLGMTIRVNAGVRGSGSGLFPYTIEDPERGEVLGGMEWVGIDETDPDEFPPADVADRGNPMLVRHHRIVASAESVRR